MPSVPRKLLEIRNPIWPCAATIPAAGGYLQQGTALHRSPPQTLPVMVPWSCWPCGMSPTAGQPRARPQRQPSIFFSEPSSSVVHTIRTHDSVPEKHRNAGRRVYTIFYMFTNEEQLFSRLLPVFWVHPCSVEIITFDTVILPFCAQCYINISLLLMLFRTSYSQLFNTASCLHCICPVICLWGPI